MSRLAPDLWAPTPHTPHARCCTLRTALPLAPCAHASRSTLVRRPSAFACAGGAPPSHLPYRCRAHVMHRGTCVCEGLPMHPLHRPCRLSDSLRTPSLGCGALAPPAPLRSTCARSGSGGAPPDFRSIPRGVRTPPPDFRSTRPGVRTPPENASKSSDPIGTLTEYKTLLEPMV